MKVSGPLLKVCICGQQNNGPPLTIDVDIRYPEAVNVSLIWKRDFADVIKGIEVRGLSWTIL
jgi:hypothetical protein